MSQAPREDLMDELDRQDDEIERIGKLFARYYECVVEQESHDYLDAGHFTPAEVQEIVEIVKKFTSDQSPETPPNPASSDP